MSNGSLKHCLIIKSWILQSMIPCFMQSPDINIVGWNSIPDIHDMVKFSEVPVVDVEAGETEEVILP